MVRRLVRGTAPSATRKTLDVRHGRPITERLGAWSIGRTIGIVAGETEALHLRHRGRVVIIDELGIVRVLESHMPLHMLAHLVTYHAIAGPNITAHMVARIAEIIGARVC